MPLPKKNIGLSIVCVLMLCNGNAQQSSPGVVPVIHLFGTAYQRGFQQGQQLRDKISLVYQRWKENIRRNTGKHPDSVLNAFRAAMNFEAAIRKHTPQSLDEIKGIANGSGQSYDDVYAFQLVDEFWIYLDQQFHSAQHHCSSIGVPSSGSQPAFIAQNIDLENFMNGFQVLLHIEPSESEPEQYIVSCAGLIALAGMNQYGIAVCLNSLMELNASTDGLPVAFIIRHLLRKQTTKDALEFLENVKHASGQNYILGLQDSVYDFEASANKVVRFLPDPNSAVVYHTNHALVNHDVKDWYKEYHEQVLAGATADRNSEQRFAALSQGLARSNDVENIKSILTSRANARNPVCRVYQEGGGGFTFSSVLFILSGQKSVQLTNGSPDQSAYSIYYFR